MTSAGSPAGDVYQDVEGLDDATVQAIVGRLESRAGHPVFSAMREAYLDRLAFPAGVAVVEIGSGTGAGRSPDACRRTAGCWASIRARS